MKHYSGIQPEIRPLAEGGAGLQFGFLLCPGFSMLDLANAIEPLSAANRLTGRTHYQWRALSLDGQSVRCTNGMSYPVDGSLDETEIFGRAFVCSFETNDTLRAPRLLGWLRRQSRRGAKLGAIGTGAAALVNAGVVGRRAFTLHWSIQNSFSELHPSQKPETQIFISDEGLLTCAGGQSVADMMVNLIEEDLGRDLSAKVTDLLIGTRPRDAQTPQRLSIVHRFGTRNPHFLSIMETLEADEMFDLTIEDLLNRHSISRRQLERLFKRFCGTTPSKFIKRMRLERAKELLEQTEMSVLQVSVACGFGSVASFSKSFMKQYHCRPSSVRS